MSGTWEGFLNLLKAPRQTGCSGNKKWESMGSPMPEGTEMLPVFTGNTDCFENIE